MVSEKAVEVAAKAAAAANSSVHDDYDLELFWSCLDDRAKAHWLRVARAALEAALPVMLGEAADRALQQQGGSEGVRGLVAKWRAESCRLNGCEDSPYTDEENGIRALKLDECADELDAALAAMGGEGEDEAFCDANCAWNDHDPKCPIWNRDSAPHQPEARVGGEAAGEPSAASMTKAFIERYESRYAPHTVKLVMAEVRARARELDASQPPPAQQPAHGVPEGMVLVSRDDLESLAGTDFGKGYWNNRAELAAMRVRALIAAAQQPEKE